MTEFLRTGAPLLLALAAALMIDRRMAAAGLLPPAFEAEGLGSEPALAALRRALGLLVVAAALWIGVFAALGAIGLELELDPAQLDTPTLFLLHGLFFAALVIWYLLGFGGTRAAGTAWLGQFGLRARSVGYELLLGAGVGVAAWLAVLTVLVGLGSLIWVLGGSDMLPREPPPVVPWLVALPVAFRLLLSLSAGVFEELFFRGFLQPRVGIALSTLFFALAHLSYEQPLMLVGITLLSLIFSYLVRWRQSIYAAVAAHAVFDALQLVVVIPWAMRMMDAEGAGSLAPVASLLGRCW